MSVHNSVCSGNPLLAALVACAALGAPGAVSAAGSPAVDRPAGPSTGIVKSVRVEEPGEGRTRVIIATSILRPTFTTWKLDAPLRVVVELTGVRPGDVDVVDAGTFAVGTIKASAARDDGGHRTRMILALRRGADYRVEAVDNEIIVDVTPREKPAVPAVVPALAADANQVVLDARRAAERSEASRLAEESSRRSAEERALRAEEEVRRLTDATRRLADERAALQKSQATAEAAHANAETLAKALLRDQAALAGRRHAGTEAQLADLARRRALAETAEKAAAEAMRRLTAEKAEVEVRRREAESARMTAAESAERLRTERAAAEKTRAEAERMRAAASDSERAAREVLARAQAVEKRAATEAEAASKAEGDKARRALDEARRETEKARQTADAASIELARVDGERKQLGRDREALVLRESALARAEQEARQVERQARESQKKAEGAEVALAQVGAERTRLQAERVEVEKERSATHAAGQAVAVQREALARQAVEQDARRKQLGEKEQALEAAAAELDRRTRELKAAQDAGAHAAQRGVDSEVARLRQELKNAKAVLDAARRAEAVARVEDVDRVAREAAAEAPPSTGNGGANRTAARGSETDDESGARPRSITLRVPSRVNRIDFVDEPARSSVIIDLDEPADFSIERPGGRHLTLRLQHAELARGLERSLDATQFFGPVRIINSFRDPGRRGTVLVDVELAEMVPNRVRQDGSRLYWDFQKPRPGSAASFPPRSDEFRAQAGMRVAAFRTMVLPLLYAQSDGGKGDRGARKKRYTGRRIDLDFKGADIHNILRLLADVGGVNIVTSDDVRGEVTIKMRDVPWDQALEVVLRAKSLGQIREGNLIRVAPTQVLEKELEQEIARQKQQVEVAPTETRLIGVSYAEAGTLEARAKDLLSPRGKISVDDRTNNLIISDVSQNLGLVEELVRNLDTQTSQVVIEARIVEARSTFSRQFGIQWGGTGFMDAEHGNPTGLVFPNGVGVGGGASDQTGSIQGLVAAPRNGVPNSQSPNYAVNLPAPAGAGVGGALGLTLGSIAGAFNLNLRLSAMEQTGQIRILSSPRISTLDNHQASVEQGVAIPISVISAAGVQTVFVDAKLNLTVKPHVTNEGTIVMDVAVTRNEPDFANTGARGDPTILKKEAKTKMLVRDGDTAVIGGIYQRNSGVSTSKVPFLADIPVIGYLFHNHRENDDRTEFLVFITPRIVNRSRAQVQ